MAEKLPTVSDLELLGGVLALDFVNTVEPRTSDGQVDLLPDYAALAAWSAHAGAVTPADAAGLGHAEPGSGFRAWRKAILLREALYRIVLALVDGAPPRAADLAVVSRAFAAAAGHARLTVDPGGIGWSWDEPLNPDRPRWEVARSAVELLTGADTGRLGICRDGDDGCGWVFLDQTKNQSRRWCDMADCGSRAKSKRYYRKKLSVSAEEKPESEKPPS
jgi:predicted RNA-binding Zn ribbon-like protein